MTLPRSYPGVLMAVLAFAGTAHGCTDPPPAHHQVEIRDLNFDPDVVEGAAGDTITWTNHDIVPHTVSGAFEGMESGTIGPGEAFSWVIEQGEPISYLCDFHPTMTGQVLIR